MPLTDTACRQAKPTDKARNGDGLYLLVNQTGKYWRMDYRYGGKRKTQLIEVYPPA